MPQTAGTTNRLWGARADDWAAHIQEGTCKPVYSAVFDQVWLKHDVVYLDMGCRSGVATQVSFECSVLCLWS